MFFKILVSGTEFYGYSSQPLVKVYGSEVVPVENKNVCSLIRKALKICY